MIADEQAPIEKPCNNRHSGEIFVVDDDGSVRDQLTAVLPLEGFPVTCFEDGEHFLSAAGASMPVCVFLHVAISERSGLEMLNDLKARHYKPPVFLITTYHHILMDEAALKYGARGFLRKPFDPYAAVERVREAVSFWNFGMDQTNARRAAATTLPDQVRLTARETQVLAHVIRGLSSLEIACALGLAERTVDDMRMKTMKKFGTKNKADLMRLVTDMV